METTEFRPSPGLHASYVQGERLGAEISELCAHIYAATYRLLMLIREFDEKGYWELPGLCSCAHWLNFQCGIGMNAAREKVRVAHALAELPRISAAFARGKLSYSKVRAMTRIADADNEEYLLMVARHGTAYHVEKLVSRYRHCRRAEAMDLGTDSPTDREIELSNLQYEQRDVSVRYEPDGSIVFYARLPAEQGALVLKALEHRMDVRQSAANRCKVVPSDVSSDVSAETREREPISRRIADALVDMAESSLAHDATASTSTADRYQVVVHVSAETLQSGSREQSPSAVELSTSDQHRSHLEDGPRVSAETSRRIACDCSCVPLFEDEEGQPLSIGRKSRSIPPSIRRALRSRDDGCRFPGCTHKRYVDGHHIKHWADGGETRLDNLVQLCRHHHHLVHEGGFTCERKPGGKLVFRDRRQRALPETVLLHPVDTDQEFGDWLLAKVPDLAIDADTCIPLWHAGETIDWDYAVGLLFNNKEGNENRCLN